MIKLSTLRRMWFTREKRNVTLGSVATGEESSSSTRGKSWSHWTRVTSLRFWNFRSTPPPPPPPPPNRTHGTARRTTNERTFCFRGQIGLLGWKLIASSALHLFPGLSYFFHYFFVSFVVGSWHKTNIRCAHIRGCRIRIYEFHTLLLL